MKQISADLFTALKLAQLEAGRLPVEFRIETGQEPLSLRALKKQE